MIQKKVCMLGAFAVGKSSLVRQYVESIFTETYSTTIGVKIDKKQLTVNDQPMTLLLWDIYGEDNLQTVSPSYMRGMAGYLIVVDLTRPNTLKSAVSLQALIQETVGNKPYLLIMNKADIKDQWQNIPEELTEDIDVLKSGASAVLETSAKSHTQVNDMFEALANAMLGKLNPSIQIQHYLMGIGIDAKAQNVTSIKVNQQLLPIEHYGNLSRCGITTIRNDIPVDRQIASLSGLLPCTDCPFILKKTQTSENCFVDIHLLIENNCQWILFIDKTQQGLALQAEQQIRLTNDMIEDNGSE